MLAAHVLQEQHPPCTTTNIPAIRIIVADVAFPQKPFLLKPFGRQNLSQDRASYSHRLSRAPMTAEKAFGMLAARWRITLRAIHTCMSVEKVDTLIVAACILHNVLTRLDEAEWRLPWEGENKYAPSGLGPQWSAHSKHTGASHCAHQGA